MTFQVIITLTVFFMVFLFISLEMINKALIVTFGASFLLLIGVLTPEEAFSKVNLHIIFLLTSLMVMANITKDTGLLQFIAIKIVKLVHADSMMILLFLSVLTGITSAFLDNVTTIIMLSPIAILIAVELQISLVPFIITMAIASNIGGTATLIGDPPNIMIGYSANLSFGDFLLNQGILILIIGVACFGITILIFRNKLNTTAERRARIMMFNETGMITNIVMSVEIIAIWTFVIIGFIFQNFTHISPTIIAMTGATTILIVTRSKPEKYFAEIEWVTVFFFVGLFILVGALEKLRIIDFIAQKLITVSGGNITVTSFAVLWGSGFLSGVIDNIPFVTVMIPLIHTLNQSIVNQGSNILWWSLSTGACLGGNLTLIGASANVVAAEIANKSGYKVKFWDFTKYGILYTVIALSIATVYFYLRYLMNFTD